MYFIEREQVCVCMCMCVCVAPERYIYRYMVLLYIPVLYIDRNQSACNWCLQMENQTIFIR